MHPALERELLPASDFRDEKGGVDVRGLFELMDLDGAALSKVLDASRQSVSQYLRKRGHVQLRDEKQRMFLVKLDHVCTLLKALTDPTRTKKEIRAWFRSPNRALRMERPIDLVMRRNLDPLVRVLTDVLNAAHGG